MPKSKEEEKETKASLEQDSAGLCVCLQLLPAAGRQVTFLSRKKVDKESDNHKIQSTLAAGTL